MNESEWKPTIRWVDQAEQLDAACQEWAGLSVIGIDTEFVRTRTFHARIGLMQVAPGRDYCALVDPIRLPDLDALGRLFAAESPVKVLHSGSEDLEIFVRLWGRAPRPLFDTQVAAALCGHGTSLSYSALVEQLLGVALSKSETRSDWTRRPLSDAQIGYAAMDAVFLSELHGMLREQLSSKGRLGWLEEDMRRLSARAESDDAAEDQFGRFKTAWKLDPLGVEILFQLVAWREGTARHRDRPRNHILEPNTLLDVAHRKPDSISKLRADVRISPRAASRYGKDLLDLVERARGVDPSNYHPAPAAPLDATTRPLMKKLKSTVREAAESLGLEPELLAGKRELVELVQTGKLPEKLSGWRRELVGDALLEQMRSAAG